MESFTTRGPSFDPLSFLRKRRDQYILLVVLTRMCNSKSSERVSTVSLSDQRDSVRFLERKAPGPTPLEQYAGGSRLFRWQRMPPNLSLAYSDYLQVPLQVRQAFSVQA